MAVNRDKKMLDLNSVLEALGKQEAVCPFSFPGILYHHIYRKIKLLTPSRIFSEISVYGSVAENLETTLCGDLDVMISPNSKNSMIKEEMIEFLPGNPLYVRIKGINHPALHSCLVEGTEYVATSALRNYHPLIFSRDIVRALPFIFNAVSHFSNFWTVKSSETSAAATFRPCEEFTSGDFATNPFETRVENKFCHFLDRARHNKAVLGCLFGEEFTRKSSPCEEASIHEESFSEIRFPLEIDFVPALRFLEWPRVGVEWITRDRHWPSPEVVQKVVHEGIHLVAKPARTSVHPETDFRMSFSHAEYILSQEMSGIQRECYFCLKRYCKAFCSTEPKGLVTFHLKHLLLKTIEETSIEMWTEQNRAECVLMLLGNLLEALRKKYLSHYFVTSYNLFCEDYIKTPHILELLAEKVEQIIENPIWYAKKLIDKETTEWKKEDRTARAFNNSMQESTRSKQSKQFCAQNGTVDDIPLD